MSDVVILKRKVRKNFTTIPNEVIQDPRLTWAASGLIGFILSLPDDFRLRLSHLAKMKSCGRDATRSRIKELEKFGYLVITRERGERGRFNNTRWEVTDNPLQEQPCPPRSGFPHEAPPETENPITVNPSSENPTLLNTDTEQVLNIKNTTTTKHLKGDQTATSGELEFPEGIPAGDISALATALSAVPFEDAQALLDELAGAMSQKGVIRTTPLRWFFGLLKRYERNQFCPTNKLAAEKRKRRDQAAVPTESEEDKKVSRQAAKERLRELKAGLTHRGPPE